MRVCIGKGWRVVAIGFRDLSVVSVRVEREGRHATAALLRSELGQVIDALENGEKAWDYGDGWSFELEPVSDLDLTVLRFNEVNLYLDDGQLEQVRKTLTAAEFDIK